MAKKKRVSATVSLSPDRDHELVAEVINHIWVRVPFALRQPLNEVATIFAIRFKMGNDKFDVDEFYRACYKED